MKKVIILIFLLISFLGKAQQKYNNLWKKVYKDELNLLPKSALEKVNDIYNRAEKDTNEVQKIKCLIYQSKFALTLEEDAQLNIVNNFKRMIDNTQDQISKAILHSLLAKIYWDYYNQYRWKIHKRTKTNKHESSEDFRTWNLDKLLTQIRIHFQASLKEKKLLQKTAKRKYKELIDINKDGAIYRPTLFDFLAHNALAFYKDTQSGLTQPKEPFLIDNENYLKEIESIDIRTKDVSSTKYQVLKIYQSLILFHKKEKDKIAYFKALFQAIEFIEKNGSFNHKKEIKLSFLEKLTKQYPLTKTTALLYFELSKTHFEFGNRFPKDKKHQFEYVVSLKLCNQILENFPKSIVEEECKRLKNKILQQSISCKLEKYVPIQQYSKVLLTYENIKEVDFSIVKITENQKEDIEKWTVEKEKQQILAKLPRLENWKVTLPDVKDHQKHSTEVILPKLNQGNYLLVGGTEGDKFYFKSFQVTNLTLLSQSEEFYQVLDRNNGKPINNAKVHLEKPKRYKKDIYFNRNFKTNKQGVFQFNSKTSYYNMTAKVTTAQDTAVFIGLRGGNKRYNNRYGFDDDEIEIRPFLFTDRSIYRPGQTVYFKTVFVQKHKGKTEPFMGKSIALVVKDVSGNVVKNFELTPNEYGTVSGEFKLPKTGLTGKYSFRFSKSKNEFYDNNDFVKTYKTILVEEYKRPKFETNLAPVKGVFKVNDTVKVKGKATALAGSNITDAKVVYRVVREVRYPRWCWWILAPVGGQEIEQGETKTDDEGNYTIPFKALPDATINKKDQPTFYYKIYADVTDINGETRSAETQVAVGYHTLNLTIGGKDKLSVSDKKNEVNLSTENLNGVFIPALGSLKVYKLIAPKTPQRKSLWNKPDSPILSDSEYKAKFPHETFSDISNPKKWQKGTLVFQEKFDTKKTTIVALGKLKKWQTGKYIVVAETKDKYGLLIKDEKVITVFDENAKKVADQKMFDVYIDKEIYQPKDFVILSVGSASKDMTVFLEVEKDHKTFSKHQIHLNNEVQKIKIPVTEQDRGGFAIKWHWVNINSMDSGVQYVSVPHLATELSIETLTFRDLLAPGDKQKWSFKIKGTKQEKATAEVLASMYDASLDQFKPHAWSFNPIEKRTYRSSYYVSDNGSFSFQSFRLTSYNSNYYYHNHNLALENFKWFGFSFENYQWVNQQYLNKISRPKSSYTKRKDNSISKGEIKITVLDAEIGNEPLPFVSIYEKEYINKGTTTNLEGVAFLKAKNRSVLMLDYVGYELYSIKVDRRYNHYVVKMISKKDGLDAVVIGYGTQKRKALTGAVRTMQADDIEEVSNIQIRGSSSLVDNAKGSPLYVVDGVAYESDPGLSPSKIVSMDVLKDAASTAVYGTRGVNGVVVITTQAGQKKLDVSLGKVKARTNFNETAFFFPKLKTNQKGEVSFEFTMPEDLTKWKLQLLAHDKQLNTAIKTLSTVTQKQLMVIPNVPRFLREGDEITISTKIANLGDKVLQGRVKLELTNPITGKNIDALLQNKLASQSFTAAEKGNTSVSWSLQIPENISAVQYKIVAATNEFSDGEQNVLPVLSNRMLVTETLPLWVNGNQSKTFSLAGLKNNTSKTLKNHQLSLEITSNPAWYAVQALPYLMEYPHECAEQTFARYYANQLASYIVNANPKIKKVFEEWGGSGAMVSNLEKNEELKSILIQETPWLRDAQSEKEKKKRIALLFDLSKMKLKKKESLDKLENMQMYNGGFPWFKGSSYANRYITQHVVQGFAHLKHLGITLEDKQIFKIVEKAQAFLDQKILEDYTSLLRRADEVREKYKNKKEGDKNAKAYLAQKHINSMQLQYLYVLSFNTEKEQGKDVQKAVAYYTNQAVEYWKEQSLYNKGLLALIHFRNNRKVVAQKIIKSLKENSIVSDEMGMYWKENKAGWYWYQAPVETQSLLIEAFSEIENKTETVDNLKKWLLKNKQTQQWKTTKATSEAVYALLLQGSDWLAVDEVVDVKIGGEFINRSKLEDVKVEAGTGYFKTEWKADEITAEMATITLTKKDKGVAWGGLYWQYFEDLDKIKNATTPLKIKKEVFVKKNTDAGQELQELNVETPLKVGDLLTIRIEIATDRDMEFIHMKDMRAASLEPIDVLSKYKRQDGLGYYQSTKDTATHFFFDSIRKGVYVFEYDVRVSHKGMFSNGITTIQSMYAPEFSSHSKGIKVEVK